MNREQNLQRSLTASALLSFLGWAASQSRSSPPSLMPSKGKTRGRKSRMVASTGLGGMNPSKSSDLRIRPPNQFNVPKKVPRSLQNQVVWSIVKTESTITTSVSSIVETNFSFALTSHPQSSNFTTEYDQWCLPQVTVEFDSQLPPGSTTPPIKLYTALDFDSSSNVGSVAGIEDFSSCEALVMHSQARTMRSVRPSCKVAVGAASSSPTAGLSGPQWLDCSIPGIIHYGIRSVADLGGVQFISVTTTLWFAFRNSI
jgi:hypothetical protein